MSKSKRDPRRPGMRFVAGAMLVCALAACKKDNTAEQATPAEVVAMLVPGTWYASSSMQHAMSMKVDNPGDLANAIEIGRSWAVFGSAELWIGALAGAAMIFAAIRLRRWRDDN